MIMVGNYHKTVQAKIILMAISLEGIDQSHISVLK